MNLRAAVFVVFALCASFGLIDGYFLSRQSSTPRAFDLLFALVTMVTAYLWYRRDSLSRKYQGSLPLAGAVILLPPLGIIIYLAKSRVGGKKLTSILLLFCLVVLAMLVGGGVTALYSLARGA